jgi:hypothetical protein
MDEPARQQAFVTALVTEHFVQASARAATITESNGRAAIYLSAVSSGLVAFGFLAQGAGRVDPFVAAVLPALFILGIFTFIRLVQTSIEAAVLSVQIQRIRGYYRTLVPEAQQFFDAPGTNDALAVAMATSGNRASPVEMLFTAAAMIAAVNSILGGAGPGPARRHAHPAWISGRPGRWRGRRGALVRAAPAVWLPTSRANGRMATTDGAPSPPSPATSPRQQSRPPCFFFSTPAGCQDRAAPRTGPSPRATRHQPGRVSAHRRSFVVDGTKIATKLEVHATPLDQALADTLSSYRTTTS